MGIIKFDFLNRIWTIGWVSPKYYYKLTWIYCFYYYKNMVWQLRMFGLFITSTNKNSLWRPK